MTKLRALIVVSFAAVVAALGLALHAGPAAAGPASSWAQTATCPGNGLVLTLVASNLRNSSQGTGALRQWAVTGDVTVAAANGRTATYVENFQGADASPPDSGGTVVTGSSVQVTAGGGPFVVDGVAYLAPGGFLGRVSGTTTSVCAALGG